MVPQPATAIIVNQISPTKLEIIIDKDSYDAHQRHLTARAIRKIEKIRVTIYTEWKRVIETFNASCYIILLSETCSTYDEYYMSASQYLRPYMRYIWESYHDYLFDDMIDAQRAQLFRFRHLEAIQWHIQMYCDLVLQRVLIGGYFKYLSRSN